VPKPATTFRPGEEVEVKQLTGWKTGSVLTANALGSGRELYQVQVKGDAFPRTYRLDQVRRPAVCENCAELERKNKDLEARLALTTDELRKWVNAG